LKPALQQHIYKGVPVCSALHLFQLLWSARSGFCLQCITNLYDARGSYCGRV